MVLLLLGRRFLSSSKDFPPLVALLTVFLLLIGLLWLLLLLGHLLLAFLQLLIEFLDVILIVQHELLNMRLNLLAAFEKHRVVGVDVP